MTEDNKYDLTIYDIDEAEAAAKSAYEEWHTVPVPNRTRYLFKYLQLLEENKEELAQILTQENGKALNDSRGEVQRGIEVVEHATSTTNLMLGYALLSIATSIVVYLWIYFFLIIAVISIC